MARRYFGELSKAAAQDLFEKWSATVPQRAAWFEREVPLVAAVRDHEPLALVEAVLVEVIGRVTFVDETPEADLPLWCVPGRTSDLPRPAELDAPSAWLVDGLVAWNVQDFLRAWPDASLFLYRNERLREVDVDHNRWVMGTEGLSMDALRLASAVHGLPYGLRTPEKLVAGVARSERDMVGFALGRNDIFGRPV